MQRSGHTFWRCRTRRPCNCLVTEPSAEKTPVKRNKMWTWTSPMQNWAAVCEHRSGHEYKHIRIPWKGLHDQGTRNHRGRRRLGSRDASEENVGRGLGTLPCEISEFNVEEGTVAGSRWTHAEQYTKHRRNIKKGGTAFKQRTSLMPWRSTATRAPSGA